MYRANYLLEDQNYAVKLIFKLKMNNEVHLRSNIFSSYLTLIQNLEAK